MSVVDDRLGALGLVLPTASSPAGNYVPVGQFYGDAVPLGSTEWIGFVFGLLSQQHYPPFVDANPAVDLATRLGEAFRADEERRALGDRCDRRDDEAGAAEEGDEAVPQCAVR